LRPDAAKRPENGEIEANGQGFQRAKGSLNKKNQRKTGNRKKYDSTRVVFQRPVKGYFTISISEPNTCNIHICRLGKFLRPDYWSLKITVTHCIHIDLLVI
jgi:hypothetical protein